MSTGSLDVEYTRYLADETQRKALSPNVRKLAANALTLIAEVERLREALDKLRALHRKAAFPASSGPDRGKPYCLHCTFNAQVDDVISYVIWPCEAARILASIDADHTDTKEQQA